MTVRRGTIRAITADGRVRVSVPSLDGGDRARDAFGQLPDAAAVGDPVRVDRDERNRLVIVAWQPAP